MKWWVLGEFGYGSLNADVGSIAFFHGGWFNLFISSYCYLLLLGLWALQIFSKKQILLGKISCSWHWSWPNFRCFSSWNDIFEPTITYYDQSDNVANRLGYLILVLVQSDLLCNRIMGARGFSDIRVIFTRCAYVVSNSRCMKW